MSDTPPRPDPASDKAAAAETGAPAEPVGSDEGPLDQLLAEARAKLEEQREAWMRALAEADNVRKRAQADVAAAHKYAIERLVQNLLPVCDSLEAALGAPGGSPEALRDGVELTLRQLKAAFRMASVTEIVPAAGERFDPHRHQAVAAVESDAEPNTVVEVMQKGYSLHERVIRPALVAVAKAKAVENAGGNPMSETGSDSN